MLLAQAGFDPKKIVLLEAQTLGEGASSRAAGMVRAQGGIVGWVAPLASRCGLSGSRRICATMRNATRGSYCDSCAARSLRCQAQLSAAEKPPLALIASPVRKRERSLNHGIDEPW